MFSESGGVEGDIEVDLTHGGCKQGRGPLGKAGARQKRPEGPRVCVCDKGGATEA